MDSSLWKKFYVVKIHEIRVTSLQKLNGLEKEMDCLHVFTFNVSISLFGKGTNQTQDLPNVIAWVVFPVTVWSPGGLLESHLAGMRQYVSLMYPLPEKLSDEDRSLQKGCFHQINCLLKKICSPQLHVFWPAADSCFWVILGDLLSLKPIRNWNRKQEMFCFSLDVMQALFIKFTKHSPLRIFCTLW